MAVMRRLPRAIGLSVLLLTSSAAPSKAQPLLTPSIRQSYEVGTGNRELIGIRDLYFTPSGGLVVLDQDMVLVFDAGGNERYTWGRMGDGPGEFRSPLSVAANDSIVLVGEAGRVGMYSLDGEYIRLYRTGGPTSFVADLGFAGGTPVALTMAIMGQSAVRRLADETEIATVEGTIRPGVLFAAVPTMTTTADGRAVTSLGSEYSLEVVDVATAEHLNGVRRDVEVRSVTTGFKDKMMGYLEDPSSAPEGWSQWVGTRPTPAAVLSRIQFAETFPVVSRMFAGPGRALWVQRGIGVGDDRAPPIDPPSAEFTSFDLFDLVSYEYRGVVQLPGDFQPMAATDTHIAGVVTSRLVPAIRVLELGF